MKDFWENFCIVLGLAVAAAFILVGGWMIGSANAYNDNAKHDRHLSCIAVNGHIEYISGIGEVCKK
jgi:hypothetical protein